jgi:hypothetical protein
VDPAEIVESARSMGVTLTAEGGFVVGRPKGATPCDLAAVILEHKAELLAYFRDAQHHLNTDDVAHADNGHPLRAPSEPPKDEHENDVPDGLLTILTLAIHATRRHPRPAGATGRRTNIEDGLTVAKCMDCLDALAGITRPDLLRQAPISWTRRLAYFANGSLLKPINCSMNSGDSQTHRASVHL